MYFFGYKVMVGTLLITYNKRVMSLKILNKLTVGTYCTVDLSLYPLILSFWRLARISLRRPHVKLAIVAKLP